MNETQSGKLWKKLWKSDLMRVENWEKSIGQEFYLHCMPECRQRITDV